MGLSNILARPFSATNQILKNHAPAASFPQPHQPTRQPQHAPGNQPQSSSYVPSHAFRHGGQSASAASGTAYSAPGATYNPVNNSDFRHAGTSDAKHKEVQRQRLLESSRSPGRGRGAVSSRRSGNASNDADHDFVHDPDLDGAGQQNQGGEQGHDQSSTSHAMGQAEVDGVAHMAGALVPVAAPSSGLAPETTQQIGLNDNGGLQKAIAMALTGNLTQALSNTTITGEAFSWLHFADVAAKMRGEGLPSPIQEKFSNNEKTIQNFDHELEVLNKQEFDSNIKLENAVRPYKEQYERLIAPFMRIHASETQQIAHDKAALKERMDFVIPSLRQEETERNLQLWAYPVKTEIYKELVKGYRPIYPGERPPRNQANIATFGRAMFNFYANKSANPDYGRPARSKSGPVLSRSLPKFDAREILRATG